LEKTDETDNFDLVECTAATARNYATDALKENMTLSFDTACSELIVLGNPIFASEMIANLLDNAIRYGERGGHISICLPDDSGILEIEDDGPGISPADRERVFERFFRLPRNEDRKGSGLGLSIVQALGRRMGATVSLKSTDRGKGLKVVIQFQPAGEPVDADCSPAG
jgi:two-component system sensor histidine kinase TctE